MSPREAFATFEELERRFGLDDSPLMALMRALVEQGEAHAEAIEHLQHLQHLQHEPGREQS